MKKPQINQIDMLQATLLILNSPDHAAVIAGVPAMQRAKSALEASLNLLGALSRAQGDPLTGITMDKKRLKRSLVNRVLAVGCAAGALTYEAGSHTQAAMFRISESSLMELRDSVIDDTAQNLHDHAATLVANDPAKAAEYNLSATTLADLQSAITAYSATLGTPRAAIATRVAVTQAIAAELTRSMDNLKNVLDRLVVQFETTHPAFTAAYSAARKIVNSGNHSTRTPAAEVDTPKYNPSAG
jgi:hypothetical protein